MKKISLFKLFKIMFTTPHQAAPILEKHNEFLSYRFFGKNYYIIANPKAIKYIFDDNANNYGSIVENLFSGLADIQENRFIPPEDRLHDLNILRQFLAKDVLANYTSNIIQNISEILGKWEEFSKHGISVHTVDEIGSLIQTHLSKTLLNGVQYDTKLAAHLANSLFYFISPFVYPFVKIGKIPMPLYFKYRKDKKKFKEIATDIVKQSLGENISDNYIKVIAQSMGCKHIEQLDKNIEGHLLHWTNMLIFAMDTSVAPVTNSIAFLSLYPLIADKIHEEVNNILGTRTPNYDDLSKLPYTQAVFKEVLRLYPPGAAVVRVCHSDDKIESHEIKKDGLVIIPTCATQVLSTYWPNPEGFDPTRFLKPLSKDQQWSYLPFALGPHACIGKQFATMQAMLTLIMIAKHYHVALTPGFSFKRAAGLANKFENFTMTIYKRN